MQASLTGQENNKATIKNLEMQVGQIPKQLTERQSGHFSANTQTNLEENSNVITTQSGKVAREGSDDNLVVEKERKDETEGEKNEMEREKNRIEEEKNEKKEEKKEKE